MTAKTSLAASLARPDTRRTNCARRVLPEGAAGARGVAAGCESGCGGTTADDATSCELANPPAVAAVLNPPYDGEKRTAFFGGGGGGGVGTGGGASFRCAGRKSVEKRSLLGVRSSCREDEIELIDGLGVPRPFGEPDVPGVVGMDESDEFVLVFFSDERFGGGGSGTRGRAVPGGDCEEEDAGEPLWIVERR